MAARSKLKRWIIVLGAFTLLAALVYYSLQEDKYRYEVCMSFHGQSRCATAAGPTADAAIRRAQEVDCVQLTGTRDDDLVCLGSAPTSVRSLAEQKVKER